MKRNSTLKGLSRASSRFAKVCSLLALLLLTTQGAWAEVVASGNCGTTGHESEVTYSLTSDGVLTISGTGTMADYTKPYEASPTPWNSYSNDITSIVVENGVTTIGANAFYFIWNATSVSIGSDVVTIGDYAFNNCGKLASVNIPASVTSIGESAFESAGGNATTMTVTFADGSQLATIGQSAFKTCEKLTSITIPATVTTWGMSAFARSGLTSVTLTDGLTAIGERAFQGTGLTSVSIPASVTSIGDYAFGWCSSLSEVTFNAESLTTYGEDAFEDAASGLKIYVPYGSGNTYKTGWAAYASKIVEKENPNATYTVTMAEDAGEGWTITPADATDPEKGVKKDTEVKATYSGTKRVKSVTAVKK